ncbi:MAG: hypothetical protein ACRCZO_14775 [Cetobacterium sp.]
MEILLVKSEDLEEFESILVKTNEKHDVLDIETDLLAGSYYARITIER